MVSKCLHSATFPRLTVSRARCARLDNGITVRGDGRLCPASKQIERSRSSNLALSKHAWWETARSSTTLLHQHPDFGSFLGTRLKPVVSNFPIVDPQIGVGKDFGGREFGSQFPELKGNRVKKESICLDSGVNEDGTQGTFSWHPLFDVGGNSVGPADHCLQTAL